MMFNLILAEGALAAALVALVIGMWPNVPWNFLQYGTIILMILTPFVFLPFSRTVWLASDILIRPVTDEEMAWYDQNDQGTFRPFAER